MKDKKKINLPTYTDYQLTQVDISSLLTCKSIFYYDDRMWIFSIFELILKLNNKYRES